MLIPLTPFGYEGEDRWVLDKNKLDNFRDQLDRKEREDVSAYLESGSVVIAMMEQTRDVIDDAFSVAGGSAVVSDGIYYWRRDAAEYIRFYGIAIDPGAMRYMRLHSWRAPLLEGRVLKEIDSELERVLM